MNHSETLGEQDCEYEYEYDLVQTETFYVDLDLSTANGGRKQPLRRKQPVPQVAKEGEEIPNPEETPGASAVPANADVQAEDDDAANDNEAIQDGPDDAETPSVPSFRANDIQILDLHGRNPLVSYQNQIYHCTWSDLIGTAMFFSKAESVTEEESLMSTNGFQLINTSRIKLIGQKARLAGKPGRKRRRLAETDSANFIFESDVQNEDAVITDGKSLGEIRTSNAKVNADMKRQAAFLERLMDVKRAKGETDNVRMVFTQKKGNSQTTRPRVVDASPARRRMDSPSLATEIEELNRKVVRGDATALMRLQDIYSSLEDNALRQVPEQQILAAPSHNSGNDPAAKNILEQRQSPND